MKDTQMKNGELIRRFESVLRSPERPTVRDPRLVLEREGNLSIYYAPFEYVNPSARIALVGITPGPTQMNDANIAARDALLRGEGIDAARRAGKEIGAFSGAVLRGNLVAQLNHWGIQSWLGLQDASELFGSASHLVHTTSLLRYPVFNADKAYAGTPDMSKNALLRRYLLTFFAKEVHQLDRAIFISLGPKVQKVMDALVDEGFIPANRVMTGMLHPSGQSTYRFKYLLGDRLGPIPHHTNPAAYDAGRLRFRERYLASQW